jgi:hypothetical protein
MVKNEGEAGGGPFWVRDNKGAISLQIIETSQIDLQNLSQKRNTESATHFNPVDLVCGIKDFKGNKFDLNQFVDHKQVLLLKKTRMERFKSDMNYQVFGMVPWPNG